MKNLKPIPRFNNHGSGCSNHQNWMLDCEFTNEDDRAIMRLVLDRKIAQLEREINEKNFATT